MKRSPFLLLLLPVTFALAITPVFGAERPKPVPPGKRFVYKISHDQPQHIEVYFPPDHAPGSARIPGVLLFHGGGWSGGDLEQFRFVCDYLAGRGLVAATANYYMHKEDELKEMGPGGKRKRACVTDAVSALRWFKHHAPEMGVDARRIITDGGSAGGHLAMLATLNRGLDDPQDPPGVDTEVMGYLLFNPAFTVKGHDPTVMMTWMSSRNSGQASRRRSSSLVERMSGGPHRMNWCLRCANSP